MVSSRLKYNINNIRASSRRRARRAKSASDIRKVVMKVSHCTRFREGKKTNKVQRIRAGRRPFRGQVCAQAGTDAIKKIDDFFNRVCTAFNRHLYDESGPDEPKARRDSFIVSI